MDFCKDNIQKIEESQIKSTKDENVGDFRTRMQKVDDIQLTEILLSPEGIRDGISSNLADVKSKTELIKEYTLALGTELQ